MISGRLTAPNLNQTTRHEGRATRRQSLGLWVVLMLALSTAAASAQEITVQGGGILDRTQDSPNHQPWMNSLTVNTTLYPDGTASGMIVWTSVLNGSAKPGPGTTGYPWVIRVVSWDFLPDADAEGRDYYALYGTVVSSPQVPQDEGSFVYFAFSDGGPGGTDFYNFHSPLLHGNIVIR